MLKIKNLEVKYPAVPAPLASITDLTFRKLLDEIGGTGYMVTEMISAEGLRRFQAKTLAMIRPGDFKTPQFIQLFGAEPKPFVEAIKYVENETRFCGIDINMGCPAGKVIKKGAGAALLKTPLKMAALVREIKKNTTLPVTVKIRLGFDDVNVLENVKILAAEGADAIAVHFRLRGQGYAKEPHWHYAPLIRAEIKNTVFIGNGDIKTAAEAAEKLKIVDAVMIGRWAVANPFIFAEIAGLETGNMDMNWVFQRLLELVEAYYEPKLQVPRIKAYTRFLLSRRVHSKHMRQQIYTAKTLAEVKEHFLAFASGSQGGSFQESCPPGPPAKASY
jgi:tRNA-dihydrouridine synthase B